MNFSNPKTRKPETSIPEPVRVVSDEPDWTRTRNLHRKQTRTRKILDPIMHYRLPSDYPYFIFYLFIFFLQGFDSTSKSLALWLPPSEFTKLAAKFHCTQFHWAQMSYSSKTHKWIHQGFSTKWICLYSKSLTYFHVPWGDRGQKYVSCVYYWGKLYLKIFTFAFLIFPELKNSFIQCFFFDEFVEFWHENCKLGTNGHKILNYLSSFSEYQKSSFDVIQL